MLKQQITTAAMFTAALVILMALFAARPLVAAPGDAANTSYEPDNTPQEAKEIGALAFQQRGLTPAGDVDWAKLTVPSGSWSADFLATESTAGLLRLELYDQNLNLLESGSGDEMAIVSRKCAIDPLPGGLYYLKIEEASGAELLNYSLIWDDYEDCSLRADLAPHTWTSQGFQYPVVPNSVKGTKTASSTLYAGKPTYFDWFFINNGPGRPPGNYYSRVWVDGDLAFEQKENPINEGSVGGAADWGFVVPSPGWHTVYFEVDSDDDVPERDEGNNTWEMDFYWAPVNGWWAEFYNNQDLAGDPVLVRDDPAIDFNWQGSSPAPGVNADYFSVRWQRTLDFDAGIYLFTLLRDDGMRFYIDNEPYLDEWVQGVSTHIIAGSLGGTHTLRVEAMELQGYAQASLSWQRCYTLDVTAEPVSGGSIQISPPPNCDDQYYIEGTQVTLTATANSGYSFTGWSGAASGSSNPLVLTMDGNKSITAHFVQACYPLTLVVNPANGGLVNVQPQPNCGSAYIAGTLITLTPIPASGYHFSNWSGAIGGSDNPRTLAMDGNKSITAHFTRECYDLDLTIDPSSGGSVGVNPSPNCDGARYSAGTQVALTAHAAPGYSFSWWSGDIGGSNNPRALTMDGDRSITAHFARASRTSFMSMISFIPGAGLSCFVGPDESEPNDQPTDMGQPLCLNHTIQGRREDQRDYFAIDLPVAGEVVARLNTVQGGGGVQLVLIYGNPPYAPADQDGTLQNELQVGLASAQPGRYLVLVYTAQPNETSPAPYTLHVSFTPDS